MKNYLNLMRKLLTEGDFKEDRTGVGTYGIFGACLRWDLSQGVPLVTTKKLFLRGVVEELLWFLRGDTNSKTLEEKKVTIWRENATREFLDNRGLTSYPEGELGPVYGAQWTRWGSKPIYNDEGFLEGWTEGINQIKNLIRDLMINPNSRRHLVSAWNVSSLDEMALPPCHYGFQCDVRKGRLNLMWQQRSVDTFLGLPFNIFSYALLTYLLAAVCDLQPGELIFNGGDVHLYSNHVEQAELLLEREPYAPPQILIHKDLSCTGGKAPWEEAYQKLCALTWEDFEVVGYKSHPHIRAPMAI